MGAYIPIDFTSLGRDRLIEMLGTVIKERNEYLENLTATQTRCTELVEEHRPFLPLQRRMSAGRSKHPDGVAFRDITEEFLEFTRELGLFNEARSLDEVLDLATVCMRYYLGERSE